MSTCNSSLTSVRFGHSVAYAFDGDEVLLDAVLQVGPTESSGCQGNRYLQLWATQESGAAIKLADACLPTLWPDAQGETYVSLRTLAFPPAGQALFSLSLQLFVQEGDALRLEDQVSFDRQQAFLLPEIQGDAQVNVTEGELQVQVDGVENPRGSLNISGSLSLEVWQLNAPYAGGAFSGQRLARLELGTLAGQAALNNLSLSLPAPAAKQGEVVVMLREWTAMGDLTRDYRLLSLPTVAPAVVEVAAEETPVAAATAEVTAAVTAPAAAEKPVAKPAVKSSAKAGQVSVNEASLKELAAVKGLSKKVAEGIISGRPWASLDALKAVKGMGEKLLAKVRNGLSL